MNIRWIPPELPTVPTIPSQRVSNFHKAFGGEREPHLTEEKNIGGATKPLTLSLLSLMAQSVLSDHWVDSDNFIKCKRHKQVSKMRC